MLARIASVVFALAMILTALPAMEVKADETTIKVHFKNKDQWAKVSAYAWDGAGALMGGWPGTDISDTKDGDYYTATLTGYDAAALNIIFNDGGAGSQTVDLSLDLTKGHEWWVVPDGNNGKVTCAIATSKDEAENGKSEVFEPIIPANPTVKKSPVVDGTTVTFYYECENANTVSLAGSMNNWTPVDMKKDGNVYSYTCTLDAGTYQYKYIVNGNWYTDPFNPDSADDGSGNANSVFTVTGSASTTPDKPTTPDAPTTPDTPEIDYTPTIKESVVIDGNKVTIYYESPTASGVELFGSMNAWAAGYKMEKNGNVFSVTLELEKGDYQYKFVVNGSEWLNDPLNSNQADGNNVFSITSDAPVTDTPATGDTEQTPSTEGTSEKPEDTPAADTKDSNSGIIILVSAIITMVVVLGGFAGYLFLKKKNA